MLDYNTIFFAECQDGNGFLFHFINFQNKLHLFFNSFHTITNTILTHKKARIHSGLIYYVNFEIISELEEGAKYDFY